MKFPAPASLLALVGSGARAGAGALVSRLLLGLSDVTHFLVD